MKFEFSAGGIVYKRENNQIFVLLCQHSSNHKWVFPKGLIGDRSGAPASLETGGNVEVSRQTSADDSKSEKKEEAAIREVKEETGVDAEIIEPLKPIAFWYKFNGELIKKTVYYYLMKYVGGNTADHDFEMEKVEWVPIGEVENRLSHKSDKELFSEAKTRIEESNSAS